MWFSEERLDRRAMVRRREEDCDVNGASDVEEMTGEGSEGMTERLDRDGSRVHERSSVDMKGKMIWGLVASVVKGFERRTSVERLSRLVRKPRASRVLILQEVRSSLARLATERLGDGVDGTPRGLKARESDWRCGNC